MKKQSIYSSGIELKEVDGEFYVEGFISTPDPDNNNIVTDGEYPEVIENQASLVQQVKTRSQAALASLHHKRELGPIGVAVEAELRPNPLNGKPSAWVKTQLNKAHSKFKDTVYEIQNKLINGFSIEFVPKSSSLKEINGKMTRVIHDQDLFGFGYASYPVNPGAVITGWATKERLFEGDEEPQILPSKEEKKEEHNCPNCKKTFNNKEAMDNHKKSCGGSKMEETKESPKNDFIVTKEDYEMILKLKELQEKEAFQKKVEETVKEKLKSYDFSKKEPLVSDMPKFEAKEGKIIEKEVLDYVKAVEGKAPINVQYKAAAKLVNKHKEIVEQTRRNSLSVEERYLQNKEPQNWEVGYTSGLLSTKEGDVWKPTTPYSYANKLAVKELKFKAGLETDTNKADASWTYGSYYQSPAELNDIYQPIIINQLNDERNVWNTLQKEDWSAYSNIQFRARSARNTSASGRAEGYTMTYGSNVGRVKLQQPFSYYYVEVAVSGPEMALAAAPGGMGDVYSDEIKWSTEDLARVLDLAVIGTGDGTSEAAALGWEKLMITTGNLYGRDVTSAGPPDYTLLAAAGVDNMSSARVTLSQLRKMIRTSCDNGSSPADIAFFCRKIQQDFVKEIIQDMQRIVPTSARAGFEGNPEIDGVPIFQDHNMNTDDIFLINLKHTKVAIKIGPTYEETAKTIDRRNGYIKIYFNQYSDRPNLNYWAYGFATS